MGNGLFPSFKERILALIVANCCRACYAVGGSKHRYTTLKRVKKLPL